MSGANREAIGTSGRSARASRDLPSPTAGERFRLVREPLSARIAPQPGSRIDVRGPATACAAAPGYDARRRRQSETIRPPRSGEARQSGRRRTSRARYPSERRPNLPCSSAGARWRRSKEIRHAYQRLTAGRAPTVAPVAVSPSALDDDRSSRPAPARSLAATAHGLTRARRWRRRRRSRFLGALRTFLCQLVTR